MEKRLVQLAGLFIILLIFAILLPDKAYGTGEVDHVSLGHRLAQYFQDKGISEEAVVVLISTLPIVELRGAIPVAHWLGINPFIAYLLAIIGNMIPVIPILLLLGPISSLLSKNRLGKAFFDWFFERTRKKSAAIEKYETLGLAIFVAIPLPVTGAWTGCAAAFLFGIKYKHAVWAILLGVMCSGIIVTILTVMGIFGAIIAGIVLLGFLVVSLLEMFRKEKKEVNDLTVV
ncbi:MAG: small multi-drug export protein [Candidatus Theseobacter exili]|nr:small multi-drug export protein [Candidatus Theseobacter exili]